MKSRFPSHVTLAKHMAEENDTIKAGFKKKIQIILIVHVC